MSGSIDSEEATSLLDKANALYECATYKAPDFIIHGKIGKGSFGTIFCVSHRSKPQEKFAMKSYSKSQMLSNNLIRFLFVEKKIMTNFDHPFIVKLNYSFQNEEKLFLVMEYCEKRDLSKLVKLVDEI